MTRGVSWFLVAPLVVLGLSACQFSLFEQREAWRTDAEQRCLAEGLVKPSAFIVPVREIDGAGTCGMDHPFKVSALAQGQVSLAPTATLACPALASVDSWITETVQPAALAWFGQPVAAVKQMSSYSCRNMNGAKVGKVSEHAFGNALDVGSFILADGREVAVKTGWKGRPDEQGFLRNVQASACERFTTVLAPGSNAFHYDHIHVDLMRRVSGRAVCQPAPVRAVPPQLAPQYPPMVEAPALPPAPGYGHGVDPGYQPPMQSPVPAAYPLPPATAPSAYPYPPYPAAPPPSGRPLPPAGVGVPMVRRGADPMVTGTLGAASAFAPQPRTLSPIRLPEAVPGED